MKKRIGIRFDMEEMSEISNELVEINRDYYTKKTTYGQGSLKFPIPREIQVELNLNPGDICYFCLYSEGFYLSFKEKPITATKNMCRSRKLASAGMNNTLYLCIPPMIKNLYQEEIKSVVLMRTAGFKAHEWQLQFLFTECI